MTALSIFPTIFSPVYICIKYKNDLLPAYGDKRSAKGICFPR